MHETQQPRDPKKTTGIVYAVILVVLLLLNFWAFEHVQEGAVIDLFDLAFHHGGEGPEIEHR